MYPEEKNNLKKQRHKLIKRSWSLRSQSHDSDHVQSGITEHERLVTTVHVLSTEMSKTVLTHNPDTKFALECNKLIWNLE